MNFRVPAILGVDHIHVFVANRAASEVWYERVLGFTRTKELETWAADGGPLTLQNANGTVHLALFERPALPCRSTVALTVGAGDFANWKAHLAQSTGSEPIFEDHELSVSLYFTDPDGNPYEITTYECEVARRVLAQSAV